MIDDALTAAREALASGDALPLVALASGGALTDSVLFDAAIALAEHGADDAARAVAARVRASGLRAELDDILRVETVDRVVEEEDASEDWDEVVRTREVADDLLEEQMLAWFGGRRDLYAQQWYDEARRRGGYRPVERPLTTKVARAHLGGRDTIGQYVLYPDDTVSFGAFDLDIEPNVLASWMATSGAPASELPVLRQYAMAIVRAGATLGAPLFAEDSGGKGLHLWAFFRPRISARNARHLLLALLRGAGPQPPEVRVEVFPKQESAGPRGLSSLIKLPFGIHRQTGRRCHMLDHDLRPIEDAGTALSRIVVVPPEALSAILAGKLALLPSPELESREALAGPERARAPTATLAERLRAIQPTEEPQLAERVTSACEALRSLVHRAYTDRKLAPDEARAIAYTLGLLGTEPSTARGAFATAQVSSKELERLQRGLPPPMGCTKVRTIAKVSACAGCLKDVLPYPSPVLHALSGGTMRSERAPAYLEGLEEALAEDPFETIGASLRRIESKVDRIGRTPSRVEGIGPSPESGRPVPPARRDGAESDERASSAGKPGDPFGREGE